MARLKVIKVKIGIKSKVKNTGISVLVFGFGADSILWFPRILS